MDALRSALQPITHNLPGPIRDLGISLLGADCYRIVVHDVLDTSHDDDGACLRLAVSKALGLGIVAASSVVKVPQIVKLVRSRSAAGVSFLACALETAACLVALAYAARSGFPLSTYGETALILGQDVVVAVLVLVYRGRASLAALFVAGLAAAAAALFGLGGGVGGGSSVFAVDMERLSYLQAAAGVVGVVSKLPQILAIAQQGGTGQLSAFTVFSYLGGSLSRIFTTLQEVDDKLILYGYVSGFILNAVLAAQMIYYWNAPSEKARGKRRAVPVKAAPAAAARSSATPTKKSPTTRRRG